MKQNDNLSGLEAKNKQKHIQRDFGFAELTAISNFSFLQGASHPQEMVMQAQELGYHAIGIADYNSLAGQVRAHRAAKLAGIRFIPGARLRTLCGFEVIAYPYNKVAYGALSQCLSQIRREAPSRKNKKRQKTSTDDLQFEDVVRLSGQADFAWVIVPPKDIDDYLDDPRVVRFCAHQREHIYLLLAPYYGADDAGRWSKLSALAEHLSISILAGNDALYHVAERRILQDTVSCIRLHVKLSEAGYALQANAERHLKTVAWLQQLYHLYPHALANSLKLAAQCQFSLEELVYQYPDDSFDPSCTPHELLERLTKEGVKRRFPKGVPEKLQKILDHELALIQQLDYAAYFLTVHDIVQFARGQRILCQGRGSAANSAVCYCLGITSVDPSQLDLLFERFVSAERDEPPDIDIDFEHERREEVIQYIYQKYGRARAGIAATVITYRSRSAIRELVKIVGLSPDIATAMLSLGWGSGREPPSTEHMKRAGLDPDAPLLKMVIYLAGQLIGFPRHLSQHVGGFVITQEPLDKLVPILNAAMPDRSFIEWDKDDLDTMGMLKIDILALGMLTAIRRSFDLISAHYGIDLDLATIPAADDETYNMLCRAESVGVFQVESRAQMNMLPRLKPRDFYDLVIQVAIVRPGPIQGDMVHPYLRRRDGVEKIEYPSQELASVLGKTLGVPLFQEQAMRIAVVAAGFTPAESDQLRRAMAAFRRTGVIQKFGEKLKAGMVERGYEADFAARCFRQIEGFGEYGFPESHAASFALLVYVSAWLKCHYPAAFTAALLNSQPMGFYAPAQLVSDARRQNVDALPVCINASDYDSDLERLPIYAGNQQTRNEMALRLGFHQVTGIQRFEIEKLLATRRASGDYDSVADCAARSNISASALEKLARADAFASLGLSRRHALWAVRAVTREQVAPALPLFSFAADPRPSDNLSVDLPALTLGEEVVEDYSTLRLSLKAHPVELLRRHGYLGAYKKMSEFQALRAGQRASVSGLVICRQRPGTARGVVFLTLEDETGSGNIVVWADRFEMYRRAIIGGRLLAITGEVQRSGSVVHLIAKHVEDETDLLSQLLAHEVDDGEGAIENNLPKGLSGKAIKSNSVKAKSNTGRRTPREMPWRGLETDS